MLDFKSRGIWGEVHCGYCEAENESTWDKMHFNMIYSGIELRNKKESLSLSVVLHQFKRKCTKSQVPRSFNALKTHMELYHPNVLHTFLAGWEALPLDVRDSWLRPTYDFERPFRGVSRDGMFEKWMSWT